MTPARTPSACIAALAACVLAAPAFADDHGDVNAYVNALMRDDLVAACTAKVPALGTRMASAQSKWRARNADAIARGDDAVDKVYPTLGKTQAEREHAVHDLFAKGAGADIAANPDSACNAGLHTLEGGVPVAFNGSTRTGEELRMDLYRNVTVAAACPHPDAIDATVGAVAAGGAWTEQWTVDGCGAHKALEIAFTPTADGGTDFSIKFLAK